MMYGIICLVCGIYLYLFLYQLIVRTVITLMKIDFKTRIYILSAFFIITGLFVAFHIPCLFYQMTGKECLGCGMTRAYQSFLYGDIRQALTYHPLFWNVPFLCLFFLFYDRFSKKFRVCYLFVEIALYVILFFIRLFHI